LHLVVPAQFILANQRNVGYNPNESKAGKTACRHSVRFKEAEQAPAGNLKSRQGENG